MSSNNKQINNLDEIKQLSKEIKYIDSQIYNFINFGDYLRNLSTIKKNILKKLCPHNSKVKERDEGLYGKTYWNCPDCELQFNNLPHS
jgi:hypothetical protein